MTNLKRKVDQEKALRRRFGDSGDTPAKSPPKLFSHHFKSTLNLNALNSKKKQKSFINRVVTSVKKTIKRKGLYSKSSNKLKKLKLSSDTAAGKNKQVLKRKMTMRRKKR